jgi:hypothetical protein
MGVRVREIADVESVVAVVHERAAHLRGRPRAAP